MTELERRLIAIGRDLEYPPVPPLAATVRRRLEAGAGSLAPPSRRRLRASLPRGRRALVLAVIALVGVAATALAASPGARDALLDALGIGGVEVQSTDGPPPAAIRRELDLGRPATLSAATRRLAFEPLVPRSLGTPDRVFVEPRVGGGELSIVYRPTERLPRAAATGVGVLVTEFRGDLLGEYLKKVIPAATSVDALRVDDHHAAWISGAPHYFVYRRPAGPIAERELQVAENVLLVEHGRVLVRVEGAIGRRKAVRIARSLERI